jgi:hypothetical protein
VVGVRQATWAVDFLTAGKLLPLVLLIVLGLPRLSGAVFATQAVPNPDWTQGVLLLVFAYGGLRHSADRGGRGAAAAQGQRLRPHRGHGRHRVRLHAGAGGGGGVVPAVADDEGAPGRSVPHPHGPPGVVLITVGAMISTYGLATGSVLAAPAPALLDGPRRG